MKVKKKRERLATLGTRSWKFVILCIDDSAPLYIFLNKREEEGRALLIAAAAKGSTCRTRWPSWSSPQERAASRFDTGSAAGACNTCLMRRRWLLLTLRCVHNDPLLYSLLFHFLWSLSVFLFFGKGDMVGVVPQRSCDLGPENEVEKTSQWEKEILKAIDLRDWFLLAPLIFLLLLFSLI